ncbi:MAG: response regulator transcription factor [Cyanobacteria bacterium]|nr:response regulator transcription factor [Cyanobacteriota bacterium]
MSVVPSPFKILVAEDHELARYGLCMALEEKPNLSIVGEAEDGAQAIAMAETLNPDIILMDIGMPVMDGITATQKIKEKYDHIKVIMLTSHKDEEEVYAALAAGADAYCMKDIKIERLAQVVEMVMEGALWMDPAIAQIVLKSVHSSPTGSDQTLTAGAEKQPLEKSSSGNTYSLKSSSSSLSSPATSSRKRYNTHLTDRELEVLKLIVDGKSNKEIALILEVTSHTAKAHVCNIIQKLAVDDRTQVAVKALKEGLLENS